MRIVIATDAWPPRDGGVALTIEAVGRELRAAGDEVAWVTPDMFRTVPCPVRPAFPLSFAWPGKVARIVAPFRPDAIHIATAGPIGLAMRRWCLRRGIPFTTSIHAPSLHALPPEHPQARTRMPAGLRWHFVRWFHAPAARVMVTSATLAGTLEARGFTNVVRWPASAGDFRSHLRLIPESASGC